MGVFLSCIFANVVPRRLIDVPILPPYYVARDEQCKMREVLLHANTKDSAKVATCFGISGTAGLGKSTLATWLVRRITRFFHPYRSYLTLQLDDTLYGTLMKCPPPTCT